MSGTPRTDAAYMTSVHDDGLRIDAMFAESERLERERNILFVAVTDAIARFDRISWGWDGDCGSGNIMRDLEEARDKVCSSNTAIWIQRMDNILDSERKKGLTSVHLDVDPTASKGELAKEFCMMWDNIVWDAIVVEPEDK